MYTLTLVFPTCELQHEKLQSESINLGILQKGMASKITFYKPSLKSHPDLEESCIKTVF